MSKRRLDDLDFELLRLLIDNSNQTYRELSEKLTIHKDTVRKRIKNLVDNKIISRFTISINQNKLAALYPGIWRVMFAIKVFRDHDSIVQELLNHRNVVELNESTPAAVHDILFQAQFKSLEEFNEFTNWLKSKNDVDSSKIDVMPIYRQHKKKRRMISSIVAKKGKH